MRLTDKVVRSLPQGSYTDDSSPVVLRVRGTGARTWVVRHMSTRVDGTRYQRRTTIGRYPEIGLARARKLATKIKFGGTSADGLTIGELVDKYKDLRIPSLRPSTATNYLSMLHLDILPLWKERDATTITRADVTTLLSRVIARAESSPRKTATNVHKATNTRSLLSGLFRFGVAEGLLPADFNPIAGTRPPAPKAVRNRFLSDSEVSALAELWTERGSLATTALWLMLLTAARPGEVMGLRWREIEGDTWIIPAERSKSKRPHLVPLTSMAIKALEPLAGLSSTWAFPSRRSHLRKIDGTVVTCRRETGIEGWSAHTMRKTAAEGMTRLEVEPHAVGAVLGHLPPGVTRDHYTSRSVYLYQRTKREALQAWCDHLASIVK